MKVVDLTNKVNDLTVYNGKLYSGIGRNGKLFEWNGINKWIKVMNNTNDVIEDVIETILDYSTTGNKTFDKMLNNEIKNALTKIFEKNKVVLKEKK